MGASCPARGSFSAISKPGQLDWLRRARGQAASVKPDYWLTLPTPRPAAFARVFAPVNAAIKRAARRVGDGDGVSVIDLVPVFTPGGHFRQTITFRGRTIDARQPDGIHLSLAGAAVAATLVIDRLRADHALA